MYTTDQNSIANSQLIPIFKDLRTVALAVLKDISGQLVKQAALAGSNEARTASVDSCDPTLLVQVSNDGNQLRCNMIDTVPSLIAIWSSHMLRKSPTPAARFLRVLVKAWPRSVIHTAHDYSYDVNFDASNRQYLVADFKNTYYYYIRSTLVPQLFTPTLYLHSP